MKIFLTGPACELVSCSQALSHSMSQEQSMGLPSTSSIAMLLRKFRKFVSRNRPMRLFRRFNTRKRGIAENGSPCGNIVNEIVKRDIV